LQVAFWPALPAPVVSSTSQCSTLEARPIHVYYRLDTPEFRQVRKVGRRALARGEKQAACGIQVRGGRESAPVGREPVLSLPDGAVTQTSKPLISPAEENGSRQPFDSSMGACAATDVLRLTSGAARPSISGHKNVFEQV